MPTSFTTVSNGQTIQASHINELHAPINTLETTVAGLGSPALANISDWPSGLTATELSYVDGVTSSIQTQLNGKAASSHTHTISQISDWPAGLTATELGYMDGVTSSVQTQLDGKSGTGHNHTITALTGWPAGLTTTELGYVDGVTSAIQTQLDGKAASSHTHTISQISDWPAGLTATELGYVDGVTSAIQTQINGKAASPTGTPDGSKFYADDGTWKTPSASGLPTTGGTMTGAITVSGAISRPSTSTTNMHTAGTTDRLYWNLNATGFFVVEFGGTSAFYSNNSETASYKPILFKGGSQTPPTTTENGSWSDASGLFLQGGGGSLVNQAKLVSRANSTAYQIIPWVSGDRITIKLVDSSDKEAVVTVSTSGTVSFAAGSHADYVGSSSPASGEVGIYVSSGAVWLKPGSAGARAIATFHDKAKV